MPAADRFVAWMSQYRHIDRRYGHVYRYHSRSDAHSVALCTFVVEDLLGACPMLQEQAARRQIVYAINARFVWPLTGKSKTLDLAIGPPITAPSDTDAPILSGTVADVFISCEAKSVMTEHVKSQPRVYDELNSAHEIVHQGRPDAIASGITVVNIAETFASPLRQTTGDSLYMSRHNQPTVTARMVQHLRGLPIREAVGVVGFDAYATIVIDCDNVTAVRLWTDPPAPQPGERDHYATFLERISRQYAERFTLP